MRVAVTGGTGFVGSHSVAELLRAGHEVRLLVRSRDRVEPALRPLGFGLADVTTVEGDVTDETAVERLLDRRDAVLHGAAVFSTDPRAARAIHSTNVRGTEVVLGAAVRHGVSRIVHVSSVAAMIGEYGATLGPDSAPARPRGVYTASKAESERIARRHQAAGAPVVISYPALVMGPLDPHFGESNLMLRGILRGKALLFVSGTCPLSDVRDVARLHARLIAGPLERTRYLAPTTVPEVADFLRVIRERTGRRIPALLLPEPLIRPGLITIETALGLLRLPPYWSAQGAWFFGRRHRFDDAATRSELGLKPIALDQTVEDAIRWMARTGHISRRLAGKLAA